LIASQKWVAELVEAAGGEFLVTRARSTVETILANDPEVVVAAWCGPATAFRGEAGARSGWQAMRAVRDGRVLHQR